MCPIRLNKHTLQHCTYEELVQYGDCLNININNYKIITIVRNPYDRIVSELFYLGFIDIKSNKEFIEKQIIKFLENNNYNNYDNHKIPQYKFIMYKNKIPKKITIFKTETLTNDMHKYGFKDFDEYENKTHKDKIDYISLLSDKAKKYIYEFYRKDFELFNYNK